VNKKPLLLDTQAFLFALNSPDLIPTKTRKFFISEDHELYLSLASIWEMSIKSSLGKLKLKAPLKEIIQTSIKESGLKILPIQAEHAYLVQELTFHHKDPFDRIIIAQSTLEKMALISTDKIFDKYGIKRIW
jgi:PIN domain nuclease of toxin-antitoxin system